MNKPVEKYRAFWQRVVRVQLNEWDAMRNLVHFFQRMYILRRRDRLHKYTQSHRSAYSCTYSINPPLCTWAVLFYCFYNGYLRNLLAQAIKRNHPSVQSTEHSRLSHRYYSLFRLQNTNCKFVFHHVLFQMSNRSIVLVAYPQDLQNRNINQIEIDRKYCLTLKNWMPSMVRFILTNP